MTEADAIIHSLLNYHSNAKAKASIALQVFHIPAKVYGFKSEGMQEIHNVFFNKKELVMNPLPTSVFWHSAALSDSNNRYPHGKFTVSATAADERPVVDCE